MKKGIHPVYHRQITIKCACGAQFVAGSTVEELKTEVCSQCHPFYTGKQKLIDSAGNVDKFKKRLEAYKKISQQRKGKKAKKQKRAQLKQEKEAKEKEK